LPTWIRIMPKPHSFYSGIESDMYAWMIASVCLGLEHHISRELMNTCMSPYVSQDPGDNVFIHYCQRYVSFGRLSKPRKA